MGLILFEMMDVAGESQGESYKIVMFGAGELGQEVFREARRFGSYELISVDRYQGAPASKVADKEYVFDMIDGNAMRQVVEKEKPDVIIPEIEAIDTDMLIELEEEGWNVIPNANATKICMNRKLIRKTIAEDADVPTSDYRFTTTEVPEEFRETVMDIGFPCISKAIMSSSGKGSYLIEDESDIEKARKFAIEDARGRGDEAIIEEFIDFDTEVTELAVRHLDSSGDIKTSFPKPVGHYQIDSDYHSSWQGPKVEEYLPWSPEDERKDKRLAKEAEKKIYDVAKKITDELGGLGIFGVEMFVKEENGEVTVYGNECSPRPHDTGMVTYRSHEPGFSEGGLHLKAITGRNIPNKEENGYKLIECIKPASTHVFKSPRNVRGYGLEYKGIKKAEKYAEIYHFGKPFAYHDPHPHRIVEERMGIAISSGENVLEAKKNSEKAAHSIMMKSNQYSKWESQDSVKKHLEV